MMDQPVVPQLLHHGAAATSSSKAVICIPSESPEIVYASHAMLNVAQRVTAQVGTKQEPVWKVHQTLRTSSQGSATANTTVSTFTAKRLISCISMVQPRQTETTISGSSITLLCGFTDGTVSTWHRSQGQEQQWTESILVRADDPEYWDGRSITDIGGIQETDHGYCIVTCSSGGAFQYRCPSGIGSKEGEGSSPMTRTQLVTTPANAVRFHALASKEYATLLLIGTAAPRHNKIHVFVIYGDAAAAATTSSTHNPSTHYCGALIGHEDWITCFDWRSMGMVDHLASGSQDARIRLWKFTTNTSTTRPYNNNNAPALVEDTVNDDENDNGDDDEDEDDDDQEEMEEGESRLEIVVPGTSETSVTLEALLIGHEERVTAVAWHPNPQPIYGEDLILISSSMDRSIFIWAEVSGIWAPISRVGSAGGILGGPVGSSLLGFLNILLEPNNGSWMMGHGYGGALHFFSCERDDKTTDMITSDMTVEDRAALSPWKAQPCLTGHFEAVTDLCWESNAGEYLLTVGNDQTCRVWAYLSQVDGNKKDEQVWVELARPQVHGYNLSAITSLSTPDHRHCLVSGADEKELRVFDATRTFDRLLRQVGGRVQTEDSFPRVDLAFIPSLGLTNKATASEGAELETGDASESTTQLPLERDLGAVSIWPEVRKLYGHNTELTRLTSTTTAQSGIRVEGDMLQATALVASSAKARDVEAACIRLWNVSENRCVQVLEGGHRSTVTALAFSPDTRFLISSGKDRRLCVWERKTQGESSTWGPFSLSCARDSAHKRIVWGAHVCPFDSTVFATCSRDGTIKLWKLSTQNESTTIMEETLSFSPASLASNGKPESVTSISFAPKPTSENATILAAGLENGMIELWQVAVNGHADLLKLACVFPSELCHIASITKLAWRPLRPRVAAVNIQDEKKLVLASCSMDHGCRIFNIEI